MIHETKVTSRASAFRVYHQVKDGWNRMKDLHFQRRYMRGDNNTPGYLRRLPCYSGTISLLCVHLG
jgi:hypothetical protein